MKREGRDGRWTGHHSLTLVHSGPLSLPSPCSHPLPFPSSSLSRREKGGMKVRMWKRSIPLPSYLLPCISEDMMTRHKMGKGMEGDGREALSQLAFPISCPSLSLSISRGF